MITPLPFLGPASAYALRPARQFGSRRRPLDSSRVTSGTIYQAARGLSIVTPVNNIRECRLEHAAESVLALTYPQGS